MADGRKADGTFAEGNTGGPGRPRRAVERQYLAVTLDAVPLDLWRQIVDRAAQDALAGDAKARDWLTRYILGAEPIKPSELAADEADVSLDDEHNQARQRRADARMMQFMMNAMKSDAQKE